MKHLIRYRKIPWHVGFYEDPSGAPMKTIDPMPKDFIIPRIGESINISFANIQSSYQLIVTEIFYDYREKEVIIYLGNRIHYNPILKQLSTYEK